LLFVEGEVVFGDFELLAGNGAGFDYLGHLLCFASRYADIELTIGISITKETAPMKILVSSSAMKSMLTSSVNELPCESVSRIRNGRALAMYARSRVFVIEARISLPTSMPIL